MEKESLLRRAWMRMGWSGENTKFKEALLHSAKTPAEQLAVAILTGDDTAALILADLVQEGASEKPAGYVSRERLIEMLQELKEDSRHWCYPGNGTTRICMFCNEKNGHGLHCDFVRALEEK